MKRFAIFAGSAYYPDVGWNDFVTAFDSLGEARASIFQFGKSGLGDPIWKIQGETYDWWQIVDLVEGKILE